jgi:hypothetical protein
LWYSIKKIKRAFDLLKIKRLNRTTLAVLCLVLKLLLVLVKMGADGHDQWLFFVLHTNCLKYQNIFLPINYRTQNLFNIKHLSCVVLSIEISYIMTLKMSPDIQKYPNFNKFFCEMDFKRLFSWKYKYFSHPTFLLKDFL